MTRRDTILLFLFALAALWAPARFQNSPGYMDADYYYLGGYNLATGAGFMEPVLWNYLSGPQGLPNPSHGYWMPLTSMVASLGLRFAPAGFGAPINGFAYARIGLILIAGLVPPITAWFAFSLGGSRREGWFAGLLAVFSGFYLSFLPTTDTFGLYMVLGALFLQVAWVITNPIAGSRPAWLRRGAPLGLGLLAGAMHLARADGLAWLGLALLVPLLSPILSPRATFQASGLISWSKGISAALLLIFGGYLMVMGPWMLRNLRVFDSFFSPGGLRAVWLTQYDELFLYPPELLDFERWWASGLTAILQARAVALKTNLGTGFAVQGLIFLAPFGLVGLWQLRQDSRVQLGAVAWLVTFAVMTFVFPEPGARGGFFHSGAAIQILFWAAVPTGLEAVISRFGNWRGWNIVQATTVFQAGFVALALGLSIILVRQRVIGSVDDASWNASADHYAEVFEALQHQGGTGEEVVLVNNPPGYFLVSGQPAVVIPMGNIDTLLAVARRYQAGYLVLEPNHPAPLHDLYENPGEGVGLEYISAVGQTQLFSIE